MRSIRLLDTIVCKNKIEYIYEYSEEIAEFFNASTPFMIQYMDNVCFDDVPKSILNVPFVVNLMPLCWIFDITLAVDELDETLFYSLEKIKKGFKKIYPDTSFGGNLLVQKIVENTYELSDKTTCLFSGGVDATCTFLRHESEKPILFNVWGVDVGLDDKKGHFEMETYFKKFASNFDVEYTCIKSTLRAFLNEDLLNRAGFAKIGDYWWHGAQHSIGLLSLLAPYNYVHRVKTNYIASTFTEKEYNQGVKCVSYPVVDDELCIASTVTVHDGYELERVEKVRYICEKRKEMDKNLDLKVCFHYIDGKNCSNCEKCFRTMLAVLIYDECLEKYGFEIGDKSAKNIKAFLDNTEVGTFRWEPIQQAYIDSPGNKHIKWLASYKFNSRSIMMRVKRKMGRLLRKVSVH